MAQVYLQGSPQAAYRCLPREATHHHPPALEASRFHYPPGAFHRSSRCLAMENLEAWNSPCLQSHEHSYFRAISLMPNLRAGFTTMACFPTSMALFTSELLTKRVVPVPLDESTAVEGTVCPTTVSSPDADIRGILATGLEKAKHKSANRRQKCSIVN